MCLLIISLAGITFIGMLNILDNQHRSMILIYLFLNESCPLFCAYGMFKASLCVSNHLFPSYIEFSFSYTFPHLFAHLAIHPSIYLP